MNRPHLHLDVVVDVVCPWCFLGKRRLDAAIAACPDIAFSVAYRPFQLDPSIPKAGLPRDEYMAAKFSDRAELDEVHARLTDMGRDVGIAYAFDQIETAPNTLDAHRLVRWAAAEGAGEAMVERLFSLYFEEGADLTRRETLVAAGESVGLDRDEIEQKFDDGTDEAAVRAEIAHATDIGITGVPCVIVERRFAISGAQASETLADAFGRIAAEIDAVGA